MAQSAMQGAYLLVLVSKNDCGTNINATHLLFLTFFFYFEAKFVISIIKLVSLLQINKVITTMVIRPLNDPT